MSVELEDTQSFPTAGAGRFTLDDLDVAVVAGGPQRAARTLVPTSSRHDIHMPAAAGMRNSGWVVGRRVRRGFARLLLPFVAVGVLGACAPRERPPAGQAMADAEDGSPAATHVHDHTPRHGGTVGMAGSLHLEALVEPDGTIRLYLTDFWRNPIPASSASGSVVLGPGSSSSSSSSAARQTIPLAVSGDALVAAGPPPIGQDQIEAHFELIVAGKPVEIDFTLLVGAAACRC